MKKYVMMTLLGIAFNTMAAPADMVTINKFLEVSHAQELQ